MTYVLYKLYLFILEYSLTGKYSLDNLKFNLTILVSVLYGKIFYYFNTLNFFFICSEFMNNKLNEFQYNIQYYFVN